MQTPNIVLINCDDLGYGDLGCYGSTCNDTPVLDRLAAEGLRFTDFYMASPVCTPSRGAMMTGCYPTRIGFGAFGEEKKWVLFPGDAEGLNPEEITFARLLQQQGYATQLVGKWHCGDQPEFLPTRHGFDHYYGIPFSNDMGRQAGRKKIFPPLPLVRDEAVIQQQPDQAALTERYIEESVRFIRKNADRPFFLYLAHLYVHRPLFVPDGFMKTSRNGRYGAAVACIDWAAGVIVHELRRLGLEDNTLVIFTSDNGSRVCDEGGSNGVLRGQKGTTWEGGQRVPCIMRWPGVIPAGSTCRALASAIDFYPTLAGLGGAALPGDRTIDGKDLLPLMRAGGAGGSPHEVFYYYRMNNLEAVRDRSWKLHVHKKDEPLSELYHLDEDPGETENRYAAHPDIVARLTAHLDAGRRELGDGLTGNSAANVRPVGRVEHPRPLAEYDPDHPYIIALYDLADAG